MLTEWQVYRMFDSRRGAWATFQFLVRRRLHRRRRRRPLGRSLGERLERGGDRREAREADLALVRRAHGGQRVVLDELVHAEALARLDVAVRGARRACPRAARACAASGRQ